jgi:arginine N-succinyltransferase
MMLFRSVLSSDLNAIHHLTQKSGVGITTLPKDLELLKKRIEWSIHSYKKELQQPLSEYYLFVLENQKTKEIVGVSAIESNIGQKTPFYSYKISKHTHICHSLKIRSDYEVLTLVNDNEGRSELCTLFLDPKYRKNNNGLLLSKARFLFMAQYPERFAPISIADMRGISNKKGVSPFWEHVGSYFFKMSFYEADKLVLATNKQFIADLMPTTPIYIGLLPLEAQEVIGKPHELTQPAMNILLKEGFQYNNYVDIFDAGPTLEAPITKIRTVELSHLVTITSLSDEVSSIDYLLSNGQIPFRAMIATALINKQLGTCIISKKAAKMLQVQCGNSLRVAPLSG